VETDVSLVMFFIRAEDAVLKDENSKTQDALVALSKKYPRSIRDLERMDGNDKW
jgi:hypothetical protein